jgi:hypothetical protein
MSRLIEEEEKASIIADRSAEQADLMHIHTNMMSARFGAIPSEIKDLGETILQILTFPFSSWEIKEDDIHNITSNDVYDIGILTKDVEQKFVYRHYFTLKRDLGEGYFFNGINMSNSLAPVGKWTISDLIINQIYCESLHQVEELYDLVDPRYKLKLYALENAAYVAHIAGGQVLKDFTDCMTSHGLSFKINVTEMYI